MTKQIINSFPIYPSQQVQFKEKARKISWALSRAKLLNSELSAFKRNDTLARALGYKSHSDLVYKSKAKLQADYGKPLIIFSNEAVSKRIATTFWQEFGGTQDSHKLFQSVFDQLGDQEVDWEPGEARLSDDRYKLYIMISLNTAGIQFINITNKYILELDWKSSIKVGNVYGFSSRDDLIDLLKNYVDKPLLIEGIEEEDEHLLLTTLLTKQDGFPAPLLRSLYCEVEDQNREYINRLAQNKHLKSLF